MYQIVFRGDTALSADPAQVQARFADRFRITDPAKLASLFSGRRCVLKKGLDVDQANAYLAQLRAMGALAEMEEMVETPPPPTPAPMTLSVEATEPAPAALSVEAEPAPAPASLATSSAWTLTPVERRVEPEPEPVNPYRAPQTRESTSSFGRVGSRAQPVERPSDVSGLSWGAFFWGWIWGLFNGTYIALLTLVPVINIVMAFVLLFKGRQWAWENKQWESLEAFNRSQRRWAISGLILTVLVFILSMKFMASVQRAAEEDGYGYEDDGSGEYSEEIDVEEEDRRIAERIEQVQDPAMREKLREMDRVRREQRDGGR